MSYDRIFEYNQIVATAGNQPITTDMVRFQFGTKESQELDATISQTAYCGESLFTVFSVKDYVDGMLKDIEVQPEKYYSKRVLDFIKEITA